MKLLLFPASEKLLVCTCGEEFDAPRQAEAHVNNGECRMQAPEHGNVVSWLMGAGRRTYKEPMSEEKKEELRAYYETHKDEIRQRRQAKARERKAIINSTKRFTRGR